MGSASSQGVLQSSLYSPIAYGWLDSSDQVWVPTGQGGAAHGGPLCLTCLSRP